MSKPEESFVEDVGIDKTENLELPSLHDPIIQTFPEGGLRAWLTVAGAFCTLFVASGFTYGYGIFLSYYSTHLLKEHTISQIAWIGSSAPFIHSVIGIPVGKLYDDGYFRALLLAGSTLYVVALMVLSVCTKYYQIFLCQGLLVGIATGLLYQPSITIVSHYFEKRRALAMGIATSGASLGGVLYPILLNHLFAKIGFAWGVRAAAFMILGMLVFANLVMTTRLPTRHRGSATLHASSSDPVSGLLPEDIPKINYKKFFNPAYVITVIGAGLIMTGISFPFSYLQVFGQKNNAISTDLTFYVLSIMMTGAVFGPLVFSWLADWIGVLNVVIITVTISAGLQFALLGATTSGSIIIVGFLYGFFGGGFQALLGPIFSRLSFSVTEIGHRMGLGFFVLGVGSLIGSPIQGALLGSDFIWWKAVLFSAVGFHSVPTSFPPPL
ncbi:uncharacterized protein PAC_04724 [Phialocephala subalpina]|uniref:Major facilitator superfamily (MFS) profile domain-containing protein n=1 Tax=Phialocephala subalpina TaxID=576137 RepID=A0A1L7WPZ0_9HELO|nr:uncharacterized protein PAC_04724 [Phialocephala subalpina]